MNVAAILNGKGREIVTVTREATVQSVARTLAQHRIGAVVVTGDDGSIAGIVSERDIIKAIAASGPECLLGGVSGIMTSQVRTCAMSDTVDHVMEMMTAHRFRHMPVVGDQGLIGIVSIGDVVKHHIAEVEMEASALKTYLVSG